MSKTRRGPLVILSARISEGYSPYDHLITGDECASVIGEDYDSFAAAQAAALAAANENLDQCGGRCRWYAQHVHLEVEYHHDRWLRWQAAREAEAEAKAKAAQSRVCRTPLGGGRQGYR